MNRVRTATVAFLLASFIPLQSVPVLALGNDRQNRHEDRQDRRDDKYEKQAEKRRRQAQHREEQWERQQARRESREAYWDASRYYRRDDARYRPRRLGRDDRIYRGADNRYYCKRDDGTTGLIIGGMSGAVLGNIIAPGGSKTLGTILGAGAGALIGRAIDDGDVVCR